MLQDANYNVVALTSSNGGLMAQYTYEPYGQRVAVEEPGMDANNENVVGHQGLFFYRLNFGHSALHPDTVGLYYNRNRWLAPHIGRFLQKDPNESGQPVLEEMAMAGRALEIAQK